MRKIGKRKFIWTAFIGFSFWILGSFLLHFKLETNLIESGIADFEADFQNASLELAENTNNFVDNYPTNSSEKLRFEYAEAYQTKTGYSYFVYKKNDLDLWTNNSISLPVSLDRYWQNEEVILLSNGWYKLHRIKRGEETFFGVFLIKSQFKYQNDDLINKFSEILSSNLSGDITMDGRGFPVHNLEGETVFSVVPSEKDGQNEWMESIIFFSYLLGFIILLQLFVNAFQNILIKKPVFLIIFPLLTVVLRLIWLQTESKGIFANFELFNPELFASSELAPSLGALIINICIFYFVVHFLLKRTRDWFEKGNQQMKLVLFIIPLFLISFYTAFQINDIIYSLIYNSKISFDLERLFDLNFYSFLSIGLIGASFYAYFKLIEYIIIQLKLSKFEWNKLAFLWFVTSCVYILVDQFYYNQALLTSFWPIILSGSLLWFHFKEKDYKFVHVISMVAFISFYASFIIQGYSAEKEKEIRKFQAEKIDQDKDISTELDYDDIERKIKNDHFVVPYFNNKYNNSEFSEELENKYYNLLKDKYEFKFYLFSGNKELLVDANNFEIKEFERFQEIINNSGEVSSVSDNIYFIRDYTDKLTYLSLLNIKEKDSTYGFLITEYRSKKFPEDIGLPSLLLDDRTPNINQLKNYSIAKYVNNKLVSRKGNYNYPIVSTDWFKEKRGFIIKDNYNHYIFSNESGKITIISKEETDQIALFTSFSYLLIIFGVLLLIPLTYKQLSHKISFKNIKLNVKIQAVIIGLTLVTLVSFAIGAGTYVAQQNSETNKELIKEKIGSVKTELEGKLKKESPLNSNLSDYLEYLLKKFSNVFVTDINIYNGNGDLLASSQPKIYAHGLLSTKMNTTAYRGIELEKQSEFIHEEQIGELTYLSAYQPFFNQQGTFLAYLNVQYISRQHDLENQISGFLLAIINIMVLMLAFSTILAITVSNRLIQPLKYIQESLRKVQIGSTAKPIIYERTDEIGELVKEYNKKVEELQKNAEILAKSERESAWREMAKQVAHEIKNPLTPMKLSIQHLKRSINLADEESTQKLDRISISLIEQIDALTKIANEFSNFAKMPKAKETVLDLSEILKNSFSVFSEYEQHTLSLNIIPTEKPIIWADKDLLLRVFNNLIKNAIQAIPVGEKGIIKLILEEQNNRYVVKIIDNGVGISQEEKVRIFVPYFTTKSTGTGLGLAMSKQIIESMKGEINFESEKGVGTTFIVTFPKYNQEKDYE